MTNAMMVTGRYRTNARTKHIQNPWHGRSYHTHLTELSQNNNEKWRNRKKQARSMIPALPYKYGVRTSKTKAQELWVLISAWYWQFWTLCQSHCSQASFRTLHSLSALLKGAPGKCVHRHALRSGKKSVCLGPLTAPFFGIPNLLGKVYRGLGTKLSCRGFGMVFNQPTILPHVHCNSWSRREGAAEERRILFLALVGCCRLQHQVLTGVSSLGADLLTGWKDLLPS